MVSARKINNKYPFINFFQCFLKGKKQLDSQKTGIGQQHAKIPDGAFNLTGRRSARRVLKTDRKKNQEEYE